MWTLVKIAWRNLFRQRRRTAITATAMALSLVIAIPQYGLTLGLSAEMLKGVTGMELGHAQVHDPAYPEGRALQSTLRRPKRLLEAIRKTHGVVAATPRVHGNALASHDIQLNIRLEALRTAPVKVQFGRAIADQAPWRHDAALACEGLVDARSARNHEVTIGTVLTPDAAQPGEQCERIRIVGLIATKGLQSNSAKLTIYLPIGDMRQVFGATTLQTKAIFRHSAAIALEGIDPVNEKRITFMGDKIIRGTYLRPDARNEIVVGYRLARVMRLTIGSKLFVQSASLDQMSGTFYQEFKVIGIYRTGVEMVDRSRVFLHMKDAQRLMALQDRVHEIAILGIDAKHTKPLVDAVRRNLTHIRLKVARGGEGKRGGSQALPAPIAVYEPKAQDAALLIPYDLKRRFDMLDNIKAIARRVYAQTKVDLPDGDATVRLVGIEPAYEPALSHMDRLVRQGRLFGSADIENLDDDAAWPAVVSARQARAWHVTLGDTVKIRVRDDEAVSRWQPITVVGLFDDAKWAPEFPQVVLPYFLAQQIDAPRLNARAHEILLMPQPGQDPKAIIATTAARLSPIVRSWQQIAPDMAKLLSTQDAWIGVVLLIIFAIAALTVMNTMLMAVFERTKEFGVLKSIGMKPRQVFALITIETLALALMSITVGGVGGSALNYYLMTHGLDLSSFTNGFTYQGTFIDPVWKSLLTVKTVVLPLAMVSVVCFVVSFYPAYRAGRLKPVEALRHQQ